VLVYGVATFNSVGLPENPSTFSSKSRSIALSNVTDPQVQLGALYRQHAALTTEELWSRYYCLGGSHTKLELELYLDGAIPPPLREHNLMALALNEHFMDLDLNCFVPFMAREDLS
jgi:hypothetical protein